MKKVSNTILIIGFLLGCIALIGLGIAIMIPYGNDHEQNLKLMDMRIEFQVIGLIATIVILIGTILNNIEK